MEVISLQGGRPLRGAVAAAGSKNSSLLLMAASILASERVSLDRVPDVADVDTLALLLGHLGVEVKRGPDGRVHLCLVDPHPVTAMVDLVSQMRASVCVLGPLLATRGKAIVALPGGCALGSRPLDLHFK